MRVAIVGVGNCASALIQGVHYYSNREDVSGLVRSSIGGYKVKDIDFVIGFDVDKRKIGLPLQKAIFEKPNCCLRMSTSVMTDTSGRFSGIVEEAPRFDGVSKHMEATDINDTRGFLVDTQNEFVAQDLLDLYAKFSTLLRDKVDVLVNYLPVGSQEATEFWAHVCIFAKVPMVNCIPVFIASDPSWAKAFETNQVAVIGDDMKSQFGASILSQAFQELAMSRGHRVKCHIQQNSGGNTDFRNMLNQERLASKKISKENVLNEHGEKPEYVHAGPSDYIEYYGDTKVATFHLELEGFCGSPVVLDAKLTVQDSPNSAGVVIDAIRYVRAAQNMGIYGALKGPSAFTQKTPPEPMPLAEAIRECLYY